MGIVESFSSTIGAWFGFVGSCVAGADATCRPFLAFVLVAAVSAAALVLVMRAYGALQRAQGYDKAADRARQEERRRQERLRRSVAARVAPRPVAHRGWRMPA